MDSGLHAFQTLHSYMTIVAYDFPQWWMSIRVSSVLLYSYFVVASSAAVVYDWALTFEQEFELILNQRWSFMTVLYICVRYIGILYSVINILGNLPISITDAGCTIIWYILVWTPIIVNAMLGVIMVARIYAMYQGSKKLLIFLVVMLLACTIVSGIEVVSIESDVSTQEVAFGCPTASMINLNFLSMASTTVWEILALFLTVRIVIKHFRELRQSLTGSTIGDCFRILIESHIFYFLAFVTVACLTLCSLASTISTRSIVYSGVWSIAEVLQMFVLGPRLVLSIREHHAKIVARADGGTAMTTVAFHAGGDTSTGRDV